MTEDFLQQAIAAIKAGDKTAGKRILIDEVLRTNPRNENAWLWMTQVADADEDRINYLRHVLKINPNNETARRGVEVLQLKLSKKR
ncbi:MAG: hypothetical protein AB1801_16010 [Chloroflexota bacterium]